MYSAIVPSHVSTCPAFPPRRSSDLQKCVGIEPGEVEETFVERTRINEFAQFAGGGGARLVEQARQMHITADTNARAARSEEHTSELQSHLNIVCRLLLATKKRI